MLLTDMASLLGMASMCFHMNDKRAYVIIANELECLKRREHCQRQCSSCSFGQHLDETFDGLRYVSNVLKARCPELYFAQDLQQLEEILNHEGQN